MNSPNNLKRVSGVRNYTINTVLSGIFNKSESEAEKILDDFFNETTRKDIKLIELEEPFEFGDETGWAILVHNLN